MHFYAIVYDEDDKMDIKHLTACETFKEANRKANELPELDMGVESVLAVISGSNLNQIRRGIEAQIARRLRGWR